MLHKRSQWFEFFIGDSQLIGKLNCINRIRFNNRFTYTSLMDFISIPIFFSFFALSYSTHSKWNENIWRIKINTTRQNPFGVFFSFHSVPSVHVESFQRQIIKREEKENLFKNQFT